MPGLIIVPMDLEPGFRKADIHSIPNVSSAMVFNFFSQAAVESKQMYVCVCVSATTSCSIWYLYSNSNADNQDLLIDYVHLRRQADTCELKALVFKASDFANTETHAIVSLKVVEGAHFLRDGQCSLCLGERK